MIGVQYPFIFVHIPKTAGNALQNVLSLYSEDTLIANGHKDGIHRFGLSSTYGTTKHSTLADYFAALGSETFWSKRRFTCVRNPWDRAISFYFSPHRGYRAWDRNQFIRMLNEMRPMSDFLRLPAHETKARIDRHFNFIIRYEQLPDDFYRLCDIMGIAKKSLPMLNKGNRRPYSHYYDLELSQIVGERFREDIELFGYEFNPRKNNSI